jgi:hypothetical protein
MNVKHIGIIPSGFVWISFGSRLQLIVVQCWWATTMVFNLKANAAGTKLFEPTLHCAFIDASLVPHGIDVSTGLGSSSAKFDKS